MYVAPVALVAAFGLLQLAPVSGQQHWYTKQWKDFSFDKTKGDIVTDYVGLEWRQVQPQGCCRTIEGQNKIRDAKFRVSKSQCQVSKDRRRKRLVSRLIVRTHLPKEKKT